MTPHTAPDLNTRPRTGIHRYSLTFCTNNRRHAFTSLTAVTTVYEQIRRAAGENHFAIVAYCFMPDHVHLLIEATSAEANCLRFLSRAKQYTGYYYARAFGGRRLWQRHSYQRVLRDDEDIHAVARYIVSNPVRAGLARRVEDYPYVGSDVYPLRTGTA